MPAGARAGSGALAGMERGRVLCAAREGAGVQARRVSAPPAPAPPRPHGAFFPSARLGGRELSSPRTRFASRIRDSLWEGLEGAPCPEAGASERPFPLARLASASLPEAPFSDPRKGRAAVRPRAPWTEGLEGPLRDRCAGRSGFDP